MARCAAWIVPRPVPFLVLILFSVEFVTGTAGGSRHGSGENEAPGEACEVKTVTVSTLPVLRESELSVGSGGVGTGAAAAAADSRLLLFVRSDLPGSVSVLDDLENTALPYFTLGKSGTLFICVGTAAP